MEMGTVLIYDYRVDAAKVLRGMIKIIALKRQFPETVSGLLHDNDISLSGKFGRFRNYRVESLDDKRSGRISKPEKDETYPSAFGQGHDFPEV
jgi:hypothetical protein